MPHVPGPRGYTGPTLGRAMAWDCPSCGVENIGPVEDGCVTCGAGKPVPAMPARRLAPPPKGRVVKAGPPTPPAAPEPPTEEVEPSPPTFAGSIMVLMSPTTATVHLSTVDRIISGRGETVLLAFADAWEQFERHRQQDLAVFFHADGTPFSLEEHEILCVSLQEYIGTHPDEEALTPGVLRDLLLKFLELESVPQ